MRQLLFYRVEVHVKYDVGDRSPTGAGGLRVAVSASRADCRECLRATLSEPPVGLAARLMAGSETGIPTVHTSKPAKGSVVTAFGHRSMTLSPGFGSQRYVWRRVLDQIVAMTGDKALI